MIFRQLIDRDTSTYTYLLADEHTNEAVLIDPVRDQVERDIQILEELGLKLRYTLETHVHADHVTGSGVLRRRVGSRSVVSRAGGAPCADMLIEDGDEIGFGSHRIRVIATPGHTSGCVSFHLPEERLVFTGDALLIRGCGRTDFQQGDARTLYRSVHDRLFTLPPDTAVYPAHDYKGRTCSTIGEEQRFNPRLGGGHTEDQFVEIMEHLDLAYPRQIDVAVPANQHCGILPDDDLMQAAEPPPEKAWAPIVRTAGGVPEVTPAWVAAHGEEARLVDVRRPDEFTGDLGHIKGAELVPLDGLESAAGGWDRNQALVTICRSGGRSGRAAETLERMGFSRVASMAGGMLAWADEGRPVA